MTLPIFETTIQHQVTNNSLSLGEGDYRRGAVTVMQQGNTLQAEVKGSEVCPDRASLQIALCRQWCLPIPIGWLKALANKPRK